MEPSSSLGVLSLILWILLFAVAIPGVIALLLIPLIRMYQKRRPPRIAPDDTPLEVTVASLREDGEKQLVTFRDPNGFDLEIEVPAAVYGALSEGDPGVLILSRNEFVSFEKKDT